MMKKVLGLGLFAGLILALSVFGFGCKKAEQAKEEAKPAAKVEAPAKGVAVAEFTFEDGKQKWFPSKNVKIAQDKSKKHGGDASLKITSSSSANLWNYAESPKFDLVPGKHYKFSGWMLVESFKSPVDKPLFQLKVGIYKDGKWIKNQITKNYDLAKKGEWQQLTVEFDAPNESNLTGNMTVDKRPMEKNIEGTIYVDDLVLEKMN